MHNAIKICISFINHLLNTVITHAYCCIIYKQFHFTMLNYGDYVASEKYKEQRANTIPCGTLWLISNADKTILFYFTHWKRLHTYDSNQLKTTEFKLNSRSFSISFCQALIKSKENTKIFHQLPKLFLAYFHKKVML